MDKNKPKKHSAPTDLIALGSGSKSTSSGTSGGSSNKPAGSSSSASRREGGSSGSSAPPSKKLRVSPPPRSSSFSGTKSSSSSSSSKPHSSSSSSSKVKKDPLEGPSASVISTSDLITDKFFTLIEKANKNKDTELAQNVLLTGLKRLRSPSAKDKELIQISQNVLLVVKSYPHCFKTVAVLDALVSLVHGKKQDVTGVKAKILSSHAPAPFATFALTIIFILYRNETHWPIPLVQLWIEDAAGDRAWVDKSIMRPLVDNILRSFATMLPSASLLPAGEGGPGGSGGGSPNPLLAMDESSTALAAELDQLIQDNKEDILDEDVIIRNRYSGLESNIESIIVDHATELVQKKSPDIPRNLLRSLCCVCGVTGIRGWVISRLEQWLHNGKLGRVAQELLLHICVNGNCSTSADIEIMTNICKFRMKTKPLTNFLCIAIREMVRDNDSNLRHVLNLTVYNELSPQRNPNNLPILGAILGGVSESRGVMADIFMDLLQKREDFHSALRLLLREIVRCAKYECDLTAFCDGLLKPRELNFLAETRERTFLAIADLVLLSMFLSVSPQVREASAVAAVRGESKDITTLQNFRALLKEMQANGVAWLYSVAPKMFRPSKPNFLSALHKLFLKDPVNDLMTKDGWPPESEKNLFSRLCVEIGLQETSLVFVLMMGVSKDHPLSANEALELVEQVVVRAALHKTGFTLQKIEIIDLLFRLSEYRHPDNISLPLGYEPPKMAVTSFYWKSWALLCLITAFNPALFGKKAWSDYPMLKMFMEMCMTNSFTFPTSSCLESETSDEIVNRELQTAGLEKEEILEFETHLAAASSKVTITEQTSLLLKQLMRLDPFGPARTPPPWILAQLQSWNEQMGIGHHLCASRSPDFLLDLIQRNSEPMPWLARLVSQGSFEILPDQCLCEFLMGHMDALDKALILSRTEEVGTPGKSPRKGVKGHLEVVGGLSKEDAKLLQLLHYLQDKVHNTIDGGEGKKILEYFMKRLSASKMQQRKQALTILRLLLSKEDEGSSPNDDWLLDSLPSLHLFADVQEPVLILIRQAILIENDPAVLCRYLEFLSTWANVCEDLDSLALDVANLVVERNGIMCLMMSKYTSCFGPLLDIFFMFVKKNRGPHKESYKWSDSQDQVLVTWGAERMEGVMNILIIHAIVILLSSYSAHIQQDTKGNQNKKPFKRFAELLDIWFPTVKGNSPKGFLLNTSEEAVLFPDWVRLKMIRSNDQRLLEAATQGLEIDQLLLFVQHFGVPLQSMTALLYIMDTVSEREPDKIARSVSQANPHFLHKLIQAQWKRGVKGGEKFILLLETRCGVNEAMDVDQRKVKPSPIRSPLTFGAVREKETKRLQAPSIKVQPPSGSGKSSSSALTVPTPAFSPTVSDKRKSIEVLSKELLQLSSPPANRRRSSVPASKGDEALNQTPRRHSAYVEEAKGKVTEDNGAELPSPSKYLGQLVDQMTQVEPCIIRNALEYQLPLLFGRSESNSGCRSFLMTTLAHQAGWETIDRCLNLFLKQFDATYDPRSVLDLIQATHSNPKLYQGVEKNLPKHQPNLSAMKLTLEQLSVMAEYIIEEISQMEMKTTKFSITNLLGPVQPTTSSKKSKHGLQSRVRLWLQCAQQDKTRVDAVVRSLLEKKWRNPCVKRFVLQIYVEFPEVILLENWRYRQGAMGHMSEDDMSSYLDGLSHALITALANTQPGKDWAKKQARDYELCLRKLVAVHPTLFLRQLKLMGALLEGRVHLESVAFHQQNHNLPFIVFLALFDLMAPHILKDFKPMKPIFLLYIKMFQNYGTGKDYSSSLSRFSILLHNFLSLNSQEVKEFLVPHYNRLRELSTLKYYVDVVPFHNLLSCLDPVTISSSSGNMPSSSGGGPQPLLGTNPAVGDYLSAASTSLHDRLLNASNDEETVPILQELDALSNRNPIILNKFSENLNSLLKSESEACRSLAFSLVLKHCTYYPSKSVNYLDTVLRLLEDDNAHLRDTMIDRVHEFVVLAQERGEDVLLRMFQLGISSNVNFLGPIQKSLALLRNYSSLVPSA